MLTRREALVLLGLLPIAASPPAAALAHQRSKKPKEKTVVLEISGMT
jgi:hypothetical protein